MIDIEKLDLEEDINYKLKCGKTIKIKHVKVKDWKKVGDCLDILQIDKNETEDINIITMSYLEYLYHLSKQDKGINYMFLSLLVNTIDGLENCYGEWKYEDNKIKYVVMKIADGQENIEFNKKRLEVKFEIGKKDFDEIRKIILYQNIYGYDDTYVNPIIRKAMERQREIEMKGQTSPTLEKQKVFVMSECSYTKKQIDNMTYRAFSLLYKTRLEMNQYYAQNIIKSGHSCTIEESIIHPMFKKEKGKFDDILVDEQSFKNKLSGATN